MLVRFVAGVCALALLAGCTPSEKAVGQRTRSSSNGSSAAQISPDDENFKNQIPLANRVSNKTSISTSGLAATNPGGSVQIVAYLDPQDAFSARTYAALRKAAAENPSYALYVRFKTNSTQPLSRLKARYIYAAESQSKFWDVADIVFGGVLGIKSEVDLVKRAKEVGINTTVLSQQAVLTTTDAKIVSDENSLNTLGSATAPSIYVNGVRVYDFEVQSNTKVKETVSRVVGG